MNTHLSLSEPHTRQLKLEPDDSRRIASLSGQLGQNLRQIEERLGTEIRHRGSQFEIRGSEEATLITCELLSNLYKITEQGELTADEVHLALQTSGIEQMMAQAEQGELALDTPNQSNQQDDSNGITLIRTKKCTIKPRGLNQQNYVRAVQKHDINFGIGPAGTGKTYLAVACAVEALLKNEVERILLVRPAVEAGEKLAEKGISAEIINIHTIKPLDNEAILKSLKKTKCVVTAEEHQMNGGLGDSVAQLLSRHLPSPQEFVAVNDSFGESGTPDQLMTKYG